MPLILLFLAYPIVVLAVFVWISICIHRTHQEKMKIIYAFHHRPITYPALAKAQEAVSFERHLRARLFCRDAWALYSPIIKEAVTNPSSEILGGFIVVMTERGQYSHSWGGVEVDSVQAVVADEDSKPPKPP